MHDVIIAGAGPSGSRCAAQLAQKGLDVLVLEASSSVPGKPVCTGIISHACVQAFSMPEAVILRDARSARLYAPSGSCLHIAREDPQACVIDRLVFNTLLAQKAVADGADLRCGCRVTGITAEPDCVRVTYQHDNCTRHEQARCAVIACGYAPQLTADAGLGKPTLVAAGAQAVVNTNSIDEVAVYTGSFSPGFFGWIVPAEPGRARVGLLARTSAGQKLNQWLVALADAGVLQNNDVPVNHGLVPLSPLPRTFAERIIAIGDAAGQVKPTSGGGIYYGMLGADAAAQTLHEALVQDNLSAAFLRRYEHRWKNSFGQEIRRGRLARKFYEKLNDRWLNRLFLAVQQAGIEAIIREAPGINFDRHAETLRSLVTWQRFRLARGLAKAAFQNQKH